MFFSFLSSRTVILFDKIISLPQFTTLSASVSCANLRTFPVIMIACMILFVGMSSDNYGAEAIWIEKALEHIEDEKESIDKLSTKLEYLRNQYTRKVKDKKQLFLTSINEDKGYSSDEIKAIEKKIDKIRKEANELEVKVVDTENQLESRQSKVTRLSSVMEKAISDYKKIKSKSDKDLDKLEIKTMDKFNNIVSGKAKTKTKKVRETSRAKRKKSRIYFFGSKDKKAKTDDKPKKKSGFKFFGSKSKKSEDKPTSDDEVTSSEKEKLIAKYKKQKSEYAAKSKIKQKKILRTGPSKQNSKTNEMAVKLATDALLIDDFNSAERKNSLGNRSNTYQMAPSTSTIDFQTDTIDGIRSGILKIDFDKKSKGGPHWQGGWCGYYTIVKDEATNVYLDGSDYNYVSFWVKGETGKENFAIGMADKRWDQLGDSVKSNQVKYYAKGSKLNKKWQKIKIPFEDFAIDKQQIASVSICFESFCFPKGDGRGTIFIDNLALEK